MIRFSNQEQRMGFMKQSYEFNKLCLVFLMGILISSLSGCGSDSSRNTTAPLRADNLNLIFVVSPDLAYNAGDINPATANLSNQGLQRSLLMATYLKQHVLGTKNVTAIYALEPMTHLQTANNYPDMAAIGYIQQFALLNQITLTGKGGAGSPFLTANSYPLNVAYASGGVPSGVSPPFLSCPGSPGCQGLNFYNTEGDNEALVAAIVKANVPGFYVFSAPWETTSALLAKINTLYGYNLKLPATYEGPNHVYVISIALSGDASLVTYNSNLNPPSTYPVLPEPVAGASCPGPDTTPELFSIKATGGINGINHNETVYLIRHAEAHPVSGWDDGNFVAAGQWRALALPNALQGKINPTQVYSIDPAQVYPGALETPGNFSFPYVRPSLTIEPYAIANNLPYYLVADLDMWNLQTSPQLTSDYFFKGGRFSNQTVLVAWEHAHIPPTIDALLANHFPTYSGPKAPTWPENDYDTIWTVRLDDKGNLTVDNELCEGIDSAALPKTAPQF